MAPLSKENLNSCSPGLRYIEAVKIQYWLASVIGLQLPHQMAKLPLMQGVLYP